MKRIHIYILTAMVLLNSSCSADWLDLNTTSSVETGQAIVTLDDAQIALNGIYRLASGHSYYGNTGACAVSANVSPCTRVFQ